MERAINCSVDDFVDKIKELPFYKTYVSSVKKNSVHTSKLLQAVTMSYALLDDEVGLMMKAIFLSLLFTIVDQKLRNEILEDGESEVKK